MLQTSSYKSRAMSFGLSLSLQLTLHLFICTITIHLGSGKKKSKLKTLNMCYSVEYLNRFKTSTLEQTMSFTYNRRTHTKWLTMDQLQINEKLNQSIHQAEVIWMNFYIYIIIFYFNIYKIDLGCYSCHCGSRIWCGHCFPLFIYGKNGFWCEHFVGKFVLGTQYFQRFKNMLLCKHVL